MIFIENIALFDFSNNLGIGLNPAITDMKRKIPGRASGPISVEIHFLGKFLIHFSFGPENLFLHRPISFLEYSSKVDKTGNALLEQKNDAMYSNSSRLIIWLASYTS